MHKPTPIPSHDEQGGKETNQIWAENAVEERDPHTIICLRTTERNDSSSNAFCGPRSHLECWDLTLKCPDASGNLHVLLTMDKIQ